MIYVKDLKHARSILDNELKARKMFALLFAPQFDEPSKKLVMDRLTYLDRRSTGNLAFLCPGYVGYSKPIDKKVWPDLEQIGKCTYRNGTVIPWAFSELLYGDFVTDLTANSKWKHSGKLSIVLLRNSRPKENSLDFRDAVSVELGKLARQSNEFHVEEVLEDLIDYVKTTPNASPFGYSDRMGKKVAKDVGEDLLAFIPGPVRKTWIRAKPWATKDLSPKT